MIACLSVIAKVGIQPAIFTPGAVERTTAATSRANRRAVR